MSADPNYFDVVAPDELSIAHLWTHYAAMVLPVGVSAAQREDMRRSFYAGFIECFRIVSDASAKLPEAQAAQVLSRLNDEGHAFFEQLKSKFLKELGQDVPVIPTRGPRG